MLRILMLSVLFGLTGGTSAATSEKTPDFSGQWYLVPELSEDPRAKLESAMRKSHQDRRRGRQQQRRRGGQYPTEAMMTTTPNKARQRNLGKLFWTATRIQIKQAAADLNMRYDGNIKRTIYTDGRGSSISATGPKDQSVHYVAWEGRELVVETTANNGTITVERFSIHKADGIVQLRIKMSMRMTHLEDPVEVTRVYRAAGMALQSVRPK